MLGSRTEGALGEVSSRSSVARARTHALLFGCALGLAALCVSAGCSAVSALSETRRAERALVSTQGLRETPAAMYALTMGRAYLEKAREEAAEAHYGNAVAYARAARHAADDAQRTQVQHVNARSARAPSAARPGQPRSRARAGETAPVAPGEGAW